MMKKKIQLQSFDILKMFVQDMNRLDGDVDLIRDKYVVDAKSLLGVMSCMTSKPMNIEFRSSNEKSISLFEELIKKYEI